MSGSGVEELVDGNGIYKTAVAYTQEFNNNTENKRLNKNMTIENKVLKRTSDILVFSIKIYTKQLEEVKKDTKQLKEVKKEYYLKEVKKDYYLFKIFPTEQKINEEIAENEKIIQGLSKSPLGQNQKEIYENINKTLREEINAAENERKSHENLMKKMENHEFCESIFFNKYETTFFDKPLGKNVLLMKYYNNFDFNNRYKRYKIKMKKDGIEMHSYNVWDWITLLKCIKEMHKAGFYHLDIKPGNLIFSGDNNKKDTFPGYEVNYRKIRVIDYGSMVFLDDTTPLPDELGVYTPEYVSIFRLYTEEISNINDLKILCEAHDNWCLIQSIYETRFNHILYQTDGWPNIPALGLYELFKTTTFSNTIKDNLKEMENGRELSYFYETFIMPECIRKKGDGIIKETDMPGYILELAEKYNTWFNENINDIADAAYSPDAEHRGVQSRTTSPPVEEVTSPPPKDPPTVEEVTSPPPKVSPSPVEDQSQVVEAPPIARGGKISRKNKKSRKTKQKRKSKSKRRYIKKNRNKTKKKSRNKRRKRK